MYILIRSMATSFTAPHLSLPLSPSPFHSHALSFIAVQCIDVTDMKTYPATIRLISWLIYQKQRLSCLIPVAIKHNILFSVPTDTAVSLPSCVIWQMKLILIKWTLKKNEFSPAIPPRWLQSTQCHLMRVQYIFWNKCARLTVHT